jgi:hypothetical protein
MEGDVESLADHVGHHQRPGVAPPHTADTASISEVESHYPTLPEYRTSCWRLPFDGGARRLRTEVEPGNCDGEPRLLKSIRRSDHRQPRHFRDGHPGSRSWRRSRRGR